MEKLEVLEGALAREAGDEEEEEGARRLTGRRESARRDTTGRRLGRAITNGMRMAFSVAAAPAPVLPERALSPGAERCQGGETDLCPGLKRKREHAVGDVGGGGGERRRDAGRWTGIGAGGVCKQRDAG